ncbi:MAG: hydrolase [Gammaproteobacteria bacterium]|nr:hydrolase [Gammaproteobacteria bacterium]NIR85461.1 hydrolase [Gammaproteobacteria bacterium]NIR89513.1 hydrolase [Gammaproteobacteria bacterium]NIU06598.1 hydrolase [Gammaproteobacteria bacterium]NIV53481.1 hydrolase [Gammaproteobacteria bacterium]
METTAGGRHTASSFHPAWWLSSAHLQTVWQTLFRHRPAVALRRERVELPDGDFIDLDWTLRGGDPVAVILHGLEGSIESPYARGTLDALARRGWRAVLMHFRGCSGEPNRLDRGYHSGDTADLQHVVALLRAREPRTPFAAVGFSLGGNVLLKWLGEQGTRAPLCAAVAVSVPFLLARVAQRLEHGFSRVYQWWLLRSMHDGLRRKFARRPPPFDLAALRTWRTFRSFDDHVTAPLHGFADAEDYYRRASSRPFLRDIRVPTLILHARDDPFMDPEVIPTPEELSPSTTLELSEQGGHVGFVDGATPLTPRYWLDERIPAFLGLHARTLERTPGRAVPAGRLRGASR